MRCQNRTSRGTFKQLPSPHAPATLITPSAAAEVGLHLANGLPQDSTVQPANIAALSPKLFGVGNVGRIEVQLAVVYGSPIKTEAAPRMRHKGARIAGRPIIRVGEQQEG